MRLWEARHDYYCNEGNYYSNDCGAEYESWADFLSEEGDSDMDMNLVFRWDWREGEDWEIPAGQAQLLLFWIGQRKGIYRYSRVTVTRDDEPAIRAWLEPRFAHLKGLWEPLT